MVSVVFGVYWVLERGGSCYTGFGAVWGGFVFGLFSGWFFFRSFYFVFRKMGLCGMFLGFSVFRVMFGFGLDFFSLCCIFGRLVDGFVIFGFVDRVVVAFLGVW